jgi:hypothetical protein
MTRQLSEWEQEQQDQQLEELYEAMAEAAGTPKFAEAQTIYFEALKQAVGEVETDDDGFERPVGGRIDPEWEPVSHIFARGQFLT